MQKSFYILLILSVILNFCSGKKDSKSTDKWIGKYSYGEEPIRANAGYYMAIQWELSISKKNDSCQGVLEINGQQTYMKLLTTISGDTNSIAIIYNRLIDGLGHNLKTGDTLFVLSNPGDKLITTWKTLEPRLADKPPKECNCFILNNGQPLKNLRKQ